MGLVWLWPDRCRQTTKNRQRWLEKEAIFFLCFSRGVFGVDGKKQDRMEGSIKIINLDGKLYMGGREKRRVDPFVPRKGEDGCQNEHFNRQHGQLNYY